MAASTLDWEVTSASDRRGCGLPGSAAYDELSKPFNARFHDVQPRAIVRCATPQDVSEAVLFVGRQGLECATRSGGHCFAGRSVSRGVVIDVSLKDAVIVLADGRLVHCDDAREGDLFWALRGAGAGNFGVVTSLVFRAVPVPDTTNFHLAWPFRNAAAVLKGWQGWAPVGPNELAASLKVTAAAEVDGPASVDVFGALLGTESDATELFDGLIVRAGSDPIRASAEQMSFSQTRQFWADLGATEDGDGPGSQDPLAQRPYFVAKSEFFSRPLPPKPASH